MDLRVQVVDVSIHAERSHAQQLHQTWNEHRKNAKAEQLRLSKRLVPRASKLGRRLIAGRTVAIVGTSNNPAVATKIL